MTTEDKLLRHKICTVVLKIMTYLYEQGDGVMRSRRRAGWGYRRVGGMPFGCRNEVICLSGQSTVWFGDW